MQHLVPKKDVHVSAQAYPWTTSISRSVVPEGLNVREILLHMLRVSNCPFKLSQLKINVEIGHVRIPRKNWHRVRPKAGAVVTVKIVPAGGGGSKNPLATVLSLALLVTVVALNPTLLAAYGSVLGVGSTAASVATALTIGVIAGVGNLLIAALAPPPKQSISAGNATTDSQTLFVQGARNQLTPYQNVPIILGKHLYVPPLGAETFTETAGSDQYCRQLFCWGLGKYQLTLLQIGTTPIDQFTDVEYQNYMNGEGNTVDSDLYPNAIHEEDLSIQITNSGGEIIRTAEVDADELIIDITCPNGLAIYDNSGNKSVNTVQIQVRYAPTGTTSWIATQVLTISQATTSVIRETVRFVTGAEGTYDVGVSRISADTDSTLILDQTWWTALRTVVYENPLGFAGVSFTTMRILATDQLNGAVDQLQSVLFSILPDWNGTDWVEGPTNNPASLFKFVAQNSAAFPNPQDAPNARPLADARVHMENLQDWYAYCVAQGFECNIVIDTDTNVWDVLTQIASTGRAVPTLIDGKWGVCIDQPQDIIAQCFNSANSWGFQGQIVYPEIPNALRIQFLNEENGYIQDEMLVFDDGYSKFGAPDVPNTIPAVSIQSLDLPGITKPSLIWKHGRKALAEMRLRPRELSFNCDPENLAVIKGSWIEFAHPVALIGTAQGYIVSVNTEPFVDHLLDDDDNPITDDAGEFIQTTGIDVPGALVDDAGNTILDDSGKAILQDGASPEPDFLYVGVTLDRLVEMSPGNQYAIRIRNKNDNTVTSWPVQFNPNPTETLVFMIAQTTVPFDVDDLFAFGIQNYEMIQCVVRDIVPDKDLNAKLTVLDAAPAIFASDTATIPAFSSGISIPTEMLRPLAPVIAAVQTGVSVQVRNVDGSISSRMVITLTNDNPFDVTPVVLIKPSNATNYVYADQIISTATKVTIEGLDVGVRYDIQVYYKRIYNSNSDGILGNTYSPIATQNNILFLGDTDLPPDITGLQLEVVSGETAILIWDIAPANILDFAYYQVRFTPEQGATDWSTAQILKDNLTSNETTLAAVSGTYMVKMFDRGGRQSQDPAIFSTAFTSEGLNAIDTVTEDPSFSGTMDNTTIISGKLVIDDTTLGSGTYTSGTTVDLGGTFTSKVAAIISADGHNNNSNMSHWPVLHLLGSLAATAPSNWQIIAQLRYTDDDPGGSPTWTDWSVITNGYYSFRAAQFRIILVGDGAQVTPRVSTLAFTVDMEDRIEADNNVDIPNTGLAVTYDVPFYAKPTLVVTVTDLQAGDVVTVIDETASGFTIGVQNASVGVERHMNYHSIGYGRLQ